MGERWRLFEIGVVGPRHEVSWVLVSAPARSKAKAEIWRRYTECFDISFRDFLKYRVIGARLCADMPTSCYDYVRRNYGLSVAIGDRVVLKNEGSSSGLQGEVVYPGPSSAHVHVVLDGRDFAVTVHPMNIDVLPREVCDAR